MSQAVDRWVRRFQQEAGEGAVQLVCLPHAGGSASFYLPMSKALSPSIEVLAVQYPGRNDRYKEPLIDNIPALADEITDVLAHLPEKPLALFGHSMGATVAFEIALRLERAGRVPLRVFASGRRAPSRRRDENVHQRDDAGLIAELRKLAGTDSRILGEEEILRMVLPAIRGDYRAVETYVHQPGPRLTCPVTVLTGDEDPKTSLEEAQAWEEHTAAGFDLHVFTGGHFFLANHQAEVLRLIQDRLAGVVPREGRAR